MEDLTLHGAGVQERVAEMVTTRFIAADPAHLAGGWSHTGEGFTGGEGWRGRRLGEGSDGGGRGCRRGRRFLRGRGDEGRVRRGKGGGCLGRKRGGAGDRDCRGSGRCGRRGEDADQLPAGDDGQYGDEAPDERPPGDALACSGGGRWLFGVVRRRIVLCHQPIAGAAPHGPGDA